MTIAYWILAEPLAAVGFVLLQIGAITMHLTGGDGQVALNVVRVITAAATVRPAMSWLRSRRALVRRRCRSRGRLGEGVPGSLPA